MNTMCEWIVNNANCIKKFVFETEEGKSTVAFNDFALAVKLATEEDAKYFMKTKVLPYCDGYIKVILK